MPKINIAARLIKLDKPNDKALARALRTLRSKENCNTAFHSTNVSNWACVSTDDVQLQMDRICHAALNYDIQHKPGHYRYLVNWTCQQLKPEYHSGDNDPHKGDRLLACRTFYEWLANYSHWARFFVGDKRINTLAKKGMILDLSAPSCIVHFLAVLWRMPGEYVELIEEWYGLYRKGIDPHLALGMAENTTGFNNPTGQIEDFDCSGHNHVGSTNMVVLARFYSGVITVEAKSSEPRPPLECVCGNDDDEECEACYGGGDDEEAPSLVKAYDVYSTACNVAFGSGPWGSGRWWQDDLLLNKRGIGKKVETKNIWGHTHVDTSVKSALFQNITSKGVITVTAIIRKIIRDRKWKM